MPHYTFDPHGTCQGYKEVEGLPCAEAHNKLGPDRYTEHVRSGCTADRDSGGGPGGLHHHLHG